MTEDTAATSSDIKGATLKVEKGNDGVYTATTDLTLTQQIDGLTSGDSVNIGGVDVPSAKWKKVGTMEIVGRAMEPQRLLGSRKQTNK